MNRSHPTPPRTVLVEDPGLRTLLRSDDFGELDALVTSILGLALSVGFHSCCR